MELSSPSIFDAFKETGFADSWRISIAVQYTKKRKKIALKKM